MLLNIGQSSDFKPFLKYSAKSGTWTIRHPGGGDQKLDQPTFVADLESIRTGWFLFREGQAPVRVLDPNLNQIAPKPHDEARRGFVLAVFNQVSFGGPAEFSSNSTHVGNAIRDVYADYEKGKHENPGKVPVVACAGSQPMKDKLGINFRPSFRLVKWVERPVELSVNGQPSPPPVQPPPSNAPWQPAGQNFADTEF